MNSTAAGSTIRRFLFLPPYVLDISMSNPSHPAQWHEKVAGFKQAADVGVGRHIVFLGDSLTEGFEFDRFWPGQPLINRGIGGDTVSGLTERLAASLSAVHPQVIFILIGINDLGERCPPPAIHHDLQILKAKLNSQFPGVRLIWQSLLPSRRDEKTGWPNLDVQEIAAVNAFISRHLVESLSDFVDLYSFFCDGENRLQKHLTTDGLHLSPAGYQLWAEVIDPLIQAEINRLNG